MDSEVTRLYDADLHHKFKKEKIHGFTIERRFFAQMDRKYYYKKSLAP